VAYAASLTGCLDDPICIGSSRTTRQGRCNSRRSPCRRNYVQNLFECERTIPLYI